MQSILRASSKFHTFYNKLYNDYFYVNYDRKHVNVMGAMRLDTKRRRVDRRTTFLHIKKRVSFYGGVSPYLVNDLFPAQVHRRTTDRSKARTLTEIPGVTRSSVVPILEGDPESAPIWSPVSCNMIYT